MAANSQEQKRYSGLKTRIQEIYRLPGQAPNRRKWLMKESLHIIYRGGQHKDGQPALRKIRDGAPGSDFPRAAARSAAASLCPKAALICPGCEGKTRPGSEGRCADACGKEVADDSIGILPRPVPAASPSCCARNGPDQLQ